MIVDSIETTALTRLLEGCSLAREVHVFEEIDSTNSHAALLAKAGTPSGTLLVADHQTAGRGRLGRSFFSPAGTGLYLSVVLRRPLSPDDMLALTACTAAAVHRALEELGIVTEIKWVNDLFLHGKKICGILTQCGFGADGRAEYYIIGIGLNVRKNPEIPTELQGIMTDLESETGQILSRTALCAAIVRALETELAGLHDRRFLPRYTKYSCTLGKSVQVEGRTGTAVGFGQDLALLVRFPDGTEEAVHSIHRI